MTITRAEAETLLLRRCSGLMDQAGLDADTADGLNLDLHDPLVYALLSLGYAPTSYGQVTDDDLDGIADSEMLSFLDLAEYRLLLNIMSNITLVDVTIGPRKESYGQLGSRLQKRVDNLKKSLRDEHGIGAGSLDVGSINLNFQTKGDDDLPYES